MTSILDLLDATNPPPIQSSALLLLVVGLLGCPANTRNFERLDGLRTVSSLFKSQDTAQEVKLKAVEFFYFYLMAEAPVVTTSGADNGQAQAIISKSAPSTAFVPENGAAQLAEIFSRSLDGNSIVRGTLDQEGRATRTVQEKRQSLGRYLSNVDDLVQDLKRESPFEGKAC